MELEEALRQKEVELALLQQSYDEFVESSKEIEAELEAALEVQTLTLTCPSIQHRLPSITGGGIDRPPA